MMYCVVILTHTKEKQINSASRAILIEGGESNDKVS